MRLRMNLVFIYLFLGFTLSAQASVSRCPGDWTEDPSTGSCYKILNEKMLWETARQKCASQYPKARLVKISSSHENEFVKGLFSQAGESNGFWMGANDIQSEDSWVWTDGTPVNYTDWGRMEPNNYDGDEDCVMWRRWRSNQDFKWNDEPCNGRYGTFPAVCEIPVTFDENTAYVSRCPGDWTEDPSTGSCYKIVNKKMSWKAAKLTCASLKPNARLVKISSSQENEFVKGLFSQAGKSNGFWMGANDIQSEDSWVWTDGTPVNYTDWRDMEPNNYDGDEDCVMWRRRRSNQDFKWNDEPCNGRYGTFPAVCEIPVTCGNNGYFDGNTGHCYNYILLDDNHRAWIEAKDECGGQGAELASIRSSQEWLFVKENILRGVNNFVWLGGTQQEYTWVWTDGSPVSFTDWIPGSPGNKSDMNCLMAHHGHGWQFYDWFCLLYYYALCKIQA